MPEDYRAHCHNCNAELETALVYGRIIRKDVTKCIHGQPLGNHCHKCPQCQCPNKGLPQGSDGGLRAPPHIYDLDSHAWDDREGGIPYADL